MAYQQIKYEVQDNILTITLNRPDKMNAFTNIMMDELIAAFDAADADDNVRAIIVTGAGRAFCAGADLSEGGATFDRAARADRKTAPLRPNGEVVAMVLHVLDDRVDRFAAEVVLAAARQGVRLVDQQRAAERRLEDCARLRRRLADVPGDQVGRSDSTR